MPPAARRGGNDTMETLIGGIALTIWLLLMIPAALICFAPGDPTAATLDRVPDNLAQLPRPESINDEDLAA